MIESNDTSDGSRIPSRCAHRWSIGITLVSLCMLIFASMDIGGYLAVPDSLKVLTFSCLGLGIMTLLIGFQAWLYSSIVLAREREDAS